MLFVRSSLAFAHPDARSAQLIGHTHKRSLLLLLPLLHSADQNNHKHTPEAHTGSQAIEHRAAAPAAFLSSNVHAFPLAGQSNFVIIIDPFNY